MRNIRDCSVVVTGGAGFLGSHMVNHLVEDRGCKVVVIDNLVAGRREFIHKGAIFEYADITGSERKLYDIFKQHQTRYVFSYAAHPYIPDSFARPLHVFNVNAMGALKVINAAQEAGCEGILQVSSAEIYGGGSLRFAEGRRDVAEYVPNSTDGKIDEEAPVIPHSTYGAAKAAIDALIQVRWREAKTPCIALRQFNCVGERETHPYVVPEIISQLAKQLPNRPDILNPAVVKLGNNSFRDFLYAGDQARIAVDLLERGDFGGVYNLGSETGVKMYDLAGLIGKVMGFADVRVEVDEVRKRPWEIWHLQSCNDKIQAATNYQRNVITPLEEALRRTVKWFEENGRKWCWE